jgi:EAL domain-containing protein (putative c-di-GMP-specific phosphodiesterase class I)
VKQDRIDANYHMTLGQVTIQQRGQLGFHVQPICNSCDLSDFAEEVLYRPAPGATGVYQLQPEILFAAQPWTNLHMMLMALDYNAKTKRKVWVNATATCFLDAELRSAMCEALTAARLDSPSQNVVIELTEHGWPNTGHIDAMVAGMEMFINSGALIAIDDIGTHSVPDKCLLDMPLSFVKYSRELLAQSRIDTAAQDRVRAIAAVCSERGVQTVAEGVENRLQYTEARGLSTFVQGYWIGHPAMPLGCTMTPHSPSVTAQSQMAGRVPVPHLHGAGRPEAASPPGSRRSEVAIRAALGRAAAAVNSA